MAFSISSADYIKWVQRSLNLTIKSALKIDGVGYDKPFLSALREFRLTAGLDYGPDFDTHPERYVDAPFQNELIKALEYASDEYSGWVSLALAASGIYVPYGTRIPSMRDQIRKFQRDYGGLSVDGYVGAKTDLALIRASTLPHPGEEAAKPRKKSKPKISDKVDSTMKEVGKTIHLSPAEKTAVEAMLHTLMKRAREAGEETPAGANIVSGGSKVANYISWVNLAVDIGRTFRYGMVSAPAGAATTAVWSAAQIAGVVAPFLQFAGFVYMIKRAMGAGYRTYGAVAIAYTITAWAFEESNPGKSQACLDNARSQPYPTFHRDKYDEAWRAAQSHTLDSLREAARSLAGHVGDYDKAKLMMRLVLQGGGKVSLARGILKGLAQQYRDEGEVQVANALDAHAKSLSYPE